MTQALHSLPLSSLVSVAVIVVAAVLLDRILIATLDRTLAHRRAQSESQETFESFLTRLTVLRRLARVVLYVLAIAAILAHVPWLRALSAGLWASAGIAGLVVGMAAKGTLGNAIAGVTLAFSQPFRVGDLVTIRSETGTVEDITLMYTFIRTGDNRRLVIPNDTLSSEVVYNHSIVDPRILSTVKFWVGYGADLERAMKSLAEVAASSPSLMPGAAPPDVAIGEAGQAAVRLDLSAWAENQSKAWALQVDLRRRGLDALRKLDALPKQLPVA